MCIASRQGGLPIVFVVITLVVADNICIFYLPPVVYACQYSLTIKHTPLDYVAIALDKQFYLNEIRM